MTNDHLSNRAFLKKFRCLYGAPRKPTQHVIISKHGDHEIEESTTPPPVDKLHEIGRTACVASDFVNPPTTSDVTSGEPKASDPSTTYPVASPVPGQVAHPALDTVVGRPNSIHRPPPKIGGDNAVNDKHLNHESKSRFNVCVSC